MQISDILIDELAYLCGIIPEYWDIFGKKHVAPIETKKAILSVMGMRTTSDEDIKQEIHKLRQRPWNNFMEPVKVISTNEKPLKIPLYIPVREGEENSLLIAWSIEDEKGIKDEFSVSGDRLSIVDQRWIDGIKYVKTELSDSRNRTIGYYTVKASCTGTDQELAGISKIIIAPDACYIPPALEKGKTWGISLNLYSIRSSQNYGVGDFGDLKKTINFIADLKGGFAGINPLHAIENRKPFGISPYSPISRMYKNFLYLDIESITDVKESKKARTLMQSEGFAQKLKELRARDLIDYEKSAALKKSLLRLAFEQFYEKHYEQDSPRGLKFKRYVTEEGIELESFATYMALSKEFGVRSSECGVKGTEEVLIQNSELLTPNYNWQEWPEEYRNPLSTAVLAFKESHKEDVLFYQYIQWLIDEQLAAIAEDAQGHGLPIGIYHDLAIGSIGGGSDAWTAQNVIAGRIDVGCPPDDFNPTGQNWGFPTLIPEKLKENGYEFFIQTIRKNMKHFGALRIDHALGMFRLFWIPRGMPPAQGAYVQFPAEDMLRIIALESIRNSTMVVAEDLGTIGDTVRESLLRFRMLSYKILYFERNYPDLSFTSPDKYPEMALCAVTTHDLPTLYGYWTGRDIELKKRLGLYIDDNAVQKQRSDREMDKGLLLQALASHGIQVASSDPQTLGSMTPELCIAIYEYLAKTPCKLAAVNLDDTLGTMDQQNMPGTTNEHPNWMQKTPVTLEQILSDKWFSSLSAMFQGHHR